MFKVTAFDRYLIRSLLPSLVILIVVICAAQVLYRAINLLDLVTTTGANPSFLPAMLLQVLPNYLDVSIPIAFAIAILFVVARFDDAKEIVAWSVAGQSPASLVRSLVFVGALLGLCSLGLRGWLEPVARHNFRSLQVQALNSGKLGTLEPASIYQPTQKFMFTYNRPLADGVMEAPFVWYKDDLGQEHIYTSTTGRLFYAKNEANPIIVLNDGIAIIQESGPTGPIKRAVFKTMRARSINMFDDEQWVRGKDHKELTLGELVWAHLKQDERYNLVAIRAEIWSRIARATILPLLPLLAFPLAFKTGDGRRIFGLFLTCVILMIAHHGLNMSKNMGALGLVIPELAIGSVTALFTLVCLLVFFLSRGVPGPSWLSRTLSVISFSTRKSTATTLPKLALHKHKLARYVLLLHLKWIVVSLAVSVTYLFTVQMFESGDAFAARALSLPDMARFFLYGLPTWTFQALPLALLIGGLTALTGLFRNSELTAMQAFGLSRIDYVRALAPLLFVFAAVLVCLIAWLIPKSSLAYTRWWSSTQIETEREAGPRHWLRSGDDVLSVRLSAHSDKQLSDVRVYARANNGRVSGITIADQAAFENARWALTNVTKHVLKDDGVETNQLGSDDWEIAITPDQLSKALSGASSFALQDIMDQLNGLAPTDRSKAYYKARLYHIVALVFLPVIILAFTMPIARASPRASLLPYYCYASFATLCYLLADGYFFALAQTGQINVVAGTIVVPVVAVLAALSVLLNQETAVLSRLFPK